MRTPEPTTSELTSPAPPVRRALSPFGVVEEKAGSRRGDGCLRRRSAHFRPASKRQGSELRENPQPRTGLPQRLSQNDDPKYDEMITSQDKLSSNNTRPENSVVRTIGE